MEDYVDSQISALKKVKRARDLVFLNRNKGQTRRNTAASQRVLSEKKKSNCFTDTDHDLSYISSRGDEKD